MKRDSPRFSMLDDFQKSIDVSFTDPGILDSALTHRSSVNEQLAPHTIEHNERLEFLGDAVLGQTIAFMLYDRLRLSPEGELSRLKSLLVSETSLAEIAIGIGIPEVLTLGRGEELSGGRKKKAIVADALEALIGAVFIDQGMGEVESLIGRLFEESLKRALGNPSKDFKTIVQEYAQKYSGVLPQYSLEATKGPEHERVFWVSCTLDGKKAGPCPGGTKKEAEQAAAENLYEALKAENPLIAERLDEIAEPAR
jgi:ribonuclease-3